ncbi:MAG TPA: c-type cytochrome domain-containing protein [Tepidisphaeraceae bacterium]|nr:c-type cytochrome domain-containing protein [Tepidisphaeraceae bacterium]
MTRRLTTIGACAAAAVLGWALAGGRAVAAGSDEAAPKPGATAATQPGTVDSPARATGPGAHDVLAARVHAIFDAKCAACHSPKAKKIHEFETILDFAKLRANKDHIVPGDPDNSSVWKSIDDDEMPPQKSNSDPKLPLLEVAEKEAVKEWIAVGAPVGQTKAYVAPAPATPKPPKSFFEKLVRWLGNFHPLAAHTPIAVLMAAAISEMLYFKYQSSALTGASRFCAVLGAMGAVATAGLGWLMYYGSANYKAGQDLVEDHKWVGTIAAAAAIPIAILGEWGARRAHRAHRAWHGWSRWAFRFLVFAIAGLVGYTAHLGGVSHWGVEFFAWPK